MLTLTKNNAKERCRTCLRKIIKSEQSDDAQNNFICITSDKGLLHLLEKFVCIEVSNQDNYDYPECLCIDCSLQLKTFESFQKKALRSAEKLFQVFCGEDIELDDNGIEGKDIVREQLLKTGNENDIFNLLLKDSLMETEAILLDGTETDNNVNNMDPDPFQTEIGDKKRKRGKRKEAFASNSSPEAGHNKSKAKCSRRFRKSKENEKNEDKLTESRFVVETKVETDTIIDTKEEGDIKVVNEVDEENAAITDDYDWQQMDFQIVEYDDSTDNEVLSKKVQSSRKEKKNRQSRKLEAVENVNDDIDYTDSDSDFLLETLKNRKEIKKSPNDTNNDNNLDDLKSELESDGISSESEFDVKLEQKKNSTSLTARKRSAASGRKKGLTNSHKCEQCKRRFGHKITLDAHIRKIHQGEKRAYKCEVCDKSYSFMGGLSTHMRETHERQEEAYKCKIPGCEKKYTSYITLQRHVRVKHLMNEVPTRYVCEQCGATFKQTSNLRYHMRTRHPTEEDLKQKEIIKERLECEICNKSFNSLYTLKYHKLRIHAGEKQYECKVCGRRVAKKFMLDQHMLVHSEDKIACKFCGREFVRKYQVEAHIKAVHQKLKPFQCPHCSESFASRKTLRHHIYIHTGEKPYVCDICGQAYRQPTCLKNHRKIHNKAIDTNTSGAASLAVNRNFLNNLIQTNEDAMDEDLGLH